MRIICIAVLSALVTSANAAGDSWHPIDLYTAIDRFNLVKGVFSNMLDRSKAVMLSSRCSRVWGPRWDVT
jgi:hypothetical protein